ncbi:MAG: hypothetical protein KAW41_06015 [Candidatus Diapherotrites archaeon]|nr:hypothetical protein [Candidatus Diapherotrites archaeon]
MKATLKLARFWFTSLWEPKKLLKELKRPSYAITLLNVLVPSIAASLFAIFVLAGGLHRVDTWAYGKTILFSTVKYFALAVIYGLGVASGRKASLRRMACLVSFPITGYLLLVDAALIMGNPIAGVPISIVLKTLLVLFALAAAGIAHAEAKMEWWKAGAWLAAVLAIVDFISPFLSAML